MEADMNETPVTTPVFSSYTGTMSLAATLFFVIRLIRDLEKQDGGPGKRSNKLYLMNSTRYQRNSNGYTHIFEVGQLNGRIVEVIHAFHDLICSYFFLFH